MRVLQVREMLRGSVVEKMRGIQDRISAGQASDYASYKQSVGRIQGMQDALDVIDAEFHALMNEGDES